MDLFADKSDQLQLMKGEFYSVMERNIDDDIVDDNVFGVKDVMELSSLVYSLQEQLMEVADDGDEEEMEVENANSDMAEENA